MTDKIIKFSAGWCSPCKMLAATLEGEDLGIPVESIDIDENEDLAKQYEIRGVPTMVLIRDDKEVARLSGMHMIGRIKDWVVTN